MKKSKDRVPVKCSMKGYALHHQHCGIYRAPLLSATALMPDCERICEAIIPYLERPDLTTIDVKVHMLMPGQFPCIPNWHCDFVPRDENGRLLPGKRTLGANMWMLVSGPPYPEFRDGRTILDWTWHRFNQFDEHRGRAAQEHGWRLFARVAPADLCPPAQPGAWLRRHSQVYLNAEEFAW